MTALIIKKVIPAGRTSKISPLNFVSGELSIQYFCFQSVLCKVGSLLFSDPYTVVFLAERIKHGSLAALAGEDQTLTAAGAHPAAK